MWSLYGEAYGGQEPDGGEDRRLERLAALRKQRMLLSGLRNDIDSSATLLGTTPECAGWQSAAGASYAARRDELRGELRRARAHVSEALDAVERSINATLRAGP